jgi:hypothetical protein
MRLSLCCYLSSSRISNAFPHTTRNLLRHPRHRKDGIFFLWGPDWKTPGVNLIIKNKTIKVKIKNSDESLSMIRLKCKIF